MNEDRLPAAGSRHYWDVTLHDGPQAGTRAPTIGKNPPPYGFMLEMPRHIDGSWFRRPQEVIDVYKVVDYKTAVYKGTIR